MNVGNQVSNIRKENQLTQEEFGKLFYGCANYPKCTGLIPMN